MLFKNLREKEGGKTKEEGGRGQRGGGGKGGNFRKLFQKNFFWKVMNNGVDDRKKGR